MRRRRPLIVWLCLLALVWCQVAMAAQACTGGEPEAGVDCHGAMADEDSESGDSPECPTQDATPDLGKLPTIAPLPGNASFLRVANARSRFDDVATLPGARAGPHVATLCQLLI